MEADSYKGFNIKPLGSGRRASFELLALIIRLFAHLKKERQDGDTTSTIAPRDRLIAYTGLSKGLVCRVLAEYNRTGQIPLNLHLKSEPRATEPPLLLEAKKIYEIRTMVMHMNRIGECVTAAKLKERISDLLQTPVTVRQIRYILHNKIGLEWRRVKKNNQAKFKPELESWIKQFIERIQANRRSPTPRLEVYLDESYVNEHHSSNYSWMPASCRSDECISGAPTGKGRRIIMMDAGSILGFVPGARRVW